jgi:hypothetical protein
MQMVYCTAPPLCSAPSSCVESGEAAAAASGVRSPSFPMQYGLMAHHKSHVLRYISNEMRTGPTLSLSLRCTFIDRPSCVRAKENPSWEQIFKGDLLGSTGWFVCLSLIIQSRKRRKKREATCAVMSFFLFEKGFQVLEIKRKRQKRAHRKLGGFFFQPPNQKEKKGAVRLPNGLHITLYYTPPPRH